MASMFDLFIIIVFVAGYLVITLEHKLSINKAATALMMAVFCWGFYFISESTHVEHVQVLNDHLHDISQIMIFLLGAMTIVELIDVHGGFKTITDFITVRSQRGLLWVVSLMTFFLSAILDNLTTTIVMLSLLRRLLPDPSKRIIFASMVVIAANAGGAWSPIGDVTTTMLWIDGRVSTASIMKLLLIPSMVSLIVPLFYFTRTLKDEALVIPESGPKIKGDIYGTKRVFFLGIGGLVFVPVLRALTGLPPFMGIIFALATVWILTDLIHQERHYLKIPHVLTKIDISSILFFLGILLAVAVLETVGILHNLAIWMDKYLGSKEVIASGLGILSAIIDNVPLTAATMGMYDLSQYPMDAKLWLMLAYSVGTGGSILIIGSAAGVVAMGMEKIRFGWYLKKISFMVLIGYLAGVLCFLLIYPWLS